MFTIFGPFHGITTHRNTHTHTHTQLRPVKRVPYFFACDRNPSTAKHEGCEPRASYVFRFCTCFQVQVCKPRQSLQHAPAAQTRHNHSIYFSYLITAVKVWALALCLWTWPNQHIVAPLNSNSGGWHETNMIFLQAQVCPSTGTIHGFGSSNNREIA